MSTLSRSQFLFFLSFFCGGGIIGEGKSTAYVVSPGPTNQKFLFVKLQSLVFRLEVDLVLPLSQEEEEDPTNFSDPKCFQPQIFFLNQNEFK